LCLLDQVLTEVVGLIQLHAMDLQISDLIIGRIQGQHYVLVVVPEPLAVIVHPGQGVVLRDFVDVITGGTGQFLAP
jgi:hypothetical protein